MIDLTPDELAHFRRLLPWRITYLESRIHKLERQELRNPAGTRRERMQEFLAEIDELLPLLDRLESDAG